MCVWLWCGCGSRPQSPKVAAQGVEVPGGMPDALRPNTRSAPATVPKKSLHVRFWCGHRTVPGLEPIFSKRVPIARKGSQTVPYSHLISAISLTHFFNGRGPLHRWRRACNRRRGPRCRFPAPTTLGADTQKKPSACENKATFRNYAVHTRCTQHATYDPRGPTRRQGLAPISPQKSHGGGRPPQRPRHEASSAQSSCEPTKPPPQPLPRRRV